MDSYFVYTGIMGITITIVSIGLSWWALQTVKFEKLLNQPKGAKAIALQIILAVVIGYQLSKFFLDYLGWSYQLRGLIQ